MNATSNIATSWKLPPLILHPFAGEKGPDQLLEGSRASMILQGLLPATNEDKEDLDRIVMKGRYQEIRMLYYLGRDLLRWTEQCVDFVRREPQLQNVGLREQSFATLLVESNPDTFSNKLRLWGISDQRSIFSRAIGLNVVFQEPPSIDSVSPVFIQNYHRFADYLFICYQNLHAAPPVRPDQFVFELYASEEYARMLADAWVS